MSEVEDDFDGDDITMPDLNEQNDEQDDEVGEDEEVVEVEEEYETGDDHCDDEVVVRKDENNLTTDVLSIYEMTNIVSIRATQISTNLNPMVDVSDLQDPILMAKRELMMRKCPLIVRRFVGEKKNAKTGKYELVYEFRNPNTMIFSTIYKE